MFLRGTFPGKDFHFFLWVWCDWQWAECSCVACTDVKIVNSGKVKWQYNRRTLDYTEPNFNVWCDGLSTSGNFHICGGSFSYNTLICQQKTFAGSICIETAYTKCKITICSLNNSPKVHLGLWELVMGNILDHKIINWRIENGNDQCCPNISFEDDLLRDAKKHHFVTLQTTNLSLDVILYTHSHCVVAVAFFFFFTFTGPFKAISALTSVFSDMQSVVTLQTQMQLLDVERI